MTLDDFEQLYRAEPDPWGYRTSEYERRKYEATLSACGDGPFDSALELGGSIGVFSSMLAPRCHALTTVDGSSTAVRTARERLRAHDSVQILLGPIPDVIPDARYDLVVASEILYYLQPDELAATLEKLSRVACPSAVLVAVHWRPAGPERPFTAAGVHARLKREKWLSHLRGADDDDYLLDVFARR